MSSRQSPPQQAEAVRDVVAPLASRAGYDLEDVQVRRAGERLLLRILVDTDGGVSLDQVAELSRDISEALDGSGVMGERSYLLDVGSPGVDRPLSLLRHWRRNTGRLVRITGVDGAVRTGRIVSAVGGALDREPDSVVLDIDGTATTVTIGEVRRAVIQVEFS
jgi:ribosome maturation factor RimP